MAEASSDDIDMFLNDFSSHDVALPTDSSNKTEECLQKLQESLEQLKSPRTGVMKGFDVGVVFPGMSETYYRCNVDLCLVLDEYKLIPDVKIYFADKHLVDPSEKNADLDDCVENSAAGANLINGGISAASNSSTQKKEKTARDYLQQCETICRIWR